MKTFLLMIALIMMTVSKFAVLDTGPPPELDKKYQESLSDLDVALVSADEPINLIQEISPPKGDAISYDTQFMQMQYMERGIGANSKLPKANSQQQTAQSVRAHIMPTVNRQLIYKEHPQSDKKIDPGSCVSLSWEIVKKDFLV